MHFIMEFSLLPATLMPVEVLDRPGTRTWHKQYLILVNRKRHLSQNIDVSELNIYCSERLEYGNSKKQMEIYLLLVFS